jgi:hypothetical protein
LDCDKPTVAKNGKELLNFYLQWMKNKEPGNFDNELFNALMQIIVRRIKLPDWYSISE